MSRVRFPVCAVLVLVLSPLASAQVVYPPRAEKMDVQIRYRIRADRDERVRQFRVLEAALKKAGFVAHPREDAELDILDPTAERFAGTVPSANIWSLLEDPRVKTILFAPVGYAYPDSADKPVPVRIGIATGFLPSEQHRFHKQVLELLDKLKFREAISYDHRGHTIIRGVLPYGNLPRLLKDLRLEPAGWFLLEPADPVPDDGTLPLRAQLPLRDTLPVRWVEVVPEGDLSFLPPSAPIAPNRTLYEPSLRNALDDMAVRDTSVPVEIVYNQNIEDRVELFRNRLRADFPRVPKAGGEYHTARIEGAVANVLTVRFGRLSDIERYVAEPQQFDPRNMAEPKIFAVRFPRAGGETLGPAYSRNTPADVLQASRLASLHAAGIRGQGSRIVVIASGFPGLNEHIGKELPKNTQYIDMTAELSPTLEPLPAFPNRASSGMATARAAHLAAPDATLVLVRVNPSALFQVYTAAKIAVGDTNYSDAMEGRIAEIGEAVSMLRVRSDDAVREYREAFANLSDDEKPAARRRAAAAALAKVRQEERDVALVYQRSEAFQKSLKSIAGANVVVNTLVWETGYPLDSLSGLSQYIDKMFAGEASVFPRSPSATRPRMPHRPIWVQPTSAMIGSIWSGPYHDTEGNGAMDFAPPEVAIPAGGWNRELNFLSVYGADGKITPNIVAGSRVRLTIQWRETHDPNVYGGRDAIFPLTLRVFRQYDPAGQKRATDELQEVAQSVGQPAIVVKQPTYGVYEQSVELTIPADGRYAVRVDGRLAFDPRLPALRPHTEVHPRLIAEFVGVGPDKGRPIFASFASRNVGVGIGGDAKASITIGETDKPTSTMIYSVSGGGPGLALLQKPDLLAVGAIDGIEGAGPAVAGGFAGGFVATLLRSGAQPNDFLRATGIPRGGPAVVPEIWQRTITTRK